MSPPPFIHVTSIGAGYMVNGWMTGVGWGFWWALLLPSILSRFMLRLSPTKPLRIQKDRSSRQKLTKKVWGKRNKLAHMNPFIMSYLSFLCSLQRSLDVCVWCFSLKFLFWCSLLFSSSYNVSSLYTHTELVNHSLVNKSETKQAFLRANKMAERLTRPYVLKGVCLWSSPADTRRIRIELGPWAKLQDALSAGTQVSRNLFLRGWFSDPSFFFFFPVYFRVRGTNS